MAFKFSQRSKDRLNSIHPDLQAVMALALERSPIDFTVLEGLRSLERQKQLVAKGASTTMNSRHLSGHAVDIAPLGHDGEVSWDWPLYHKLAPVVKQAAKDLGVDLEWGGDWRSFKDGPHWQLSWNTYAANDMTPRAKLNGERVVATAPEEVAVDEFVFREEPAALPQVAHTLTPTIPQEVIDLIEETAGAGSLTKRLNTFLKYLGEFGIGVPALLGYLGELEPPVMIALIVASAAVLGVAWYTNNSRDRKADKSLKALYAIGKDA